LIHSEVGQQPCVLSERILNLIDPN